MNLAETTPNNYSEIFAKRGWLYQRAMQTVPKARALELDQLFAAQPLQVGEHLLDVPSGGGYLAKHLQATMQPTVQVRHLEFTPGFDPGVEVVDPDGHWPVAAASMERCICLAALHHIQDPNELLLNITNVVRPLGLIHLADVIPGSGSMHFLEHFVDRHTSTGHRGIYRDFRELIWPSNLEVLTIETRACPWRFDSRQQMLHFCQLLFGLDDSCQPQLEQALEHDIGVSHRHGGVELQWSLSYADLRRRPQGSG
jgi:SAM-dependent methyltransferase